MSRKFQGHHHTRKQKGRSRRGISPGTYSQQHKNRKADRYDRPFLDGTYRHGI